MLTGFGRRSRRWITVLMLAAMGSSSLSGCSRQFWRKQAERDTYNAIGEKLNDPRWHVPRIHLTPDSRSRFYDPFDPDCAPLPPDDPAAHEFMKCVNGRKGYKNWHKLGQSLSIENPQWLEPFGIAVQGADPVIGHSRVNLHRIALPQAVELAYIHSRDYQTTLEDLYLSALALTFERFRLGVRYINASGTEPGVGVTSRTRGDGRTNGTLSSNFGISQALPVGGQIAVELANSTLWLFGSPGSSSATSLSYSLTQPLLFNAGRKIALEPLTQAERNVLYNARLLARFRQTMFTDIARDYLALLQQRQFILNTENNIRQLREQLAARQAEDSRVFGLLTEKLESFPADATIPDALRGKLFFEPPREAGETGTLKWIGTMSDTEQELLIAISQDESFQLAAETLVGFARNEATPLAQAELRTRLNRTQNQYENSKRQLADQLDTFKVSLGLPPNILMDIDESLLEPFELISRQLIRTETEFRALDANYGQAVIVAADQAEGEAIPRLRHYLSELSRLRDQLYELGLQSVQKDFDPVRRVLEVTAEDWSTRQSGYRFFTAESERDRVVKDVEQDLRFYRISERDFALYSSLLDMLIEVIDVDTTEELMRKLDTNRNGRIERSELPETWSDLPRGSSSASLSTPAGADPAADPAADMQEDVDGLTAEQFMSAARTGTKILKDRLARNAQSLQVLQAGLRAEAVALNRFVLESLTGTPDIEEVVRIGLEERHDLMNARARVTDRRRAVEIAANRLEAALDVRLQGNTALSSGSLNDTNSNYQAGLQFTTPLDQVSERNAYNTALINYQRERRAYMALEDQVKQQIRQSWRQIQVQRERVEIDRQTIRNAARQYDNASLNASRGAQQNALSLLNALDTVLQAQNSLVQDWVTYESNRLNIFRDMGIMQIDPRGVWADQFYQQMEGVPSVEGPATDPPPLPANPPVAVPPVSEPVNQ